MIERLCRILAYCVMFIAAPVHAQLQVDITSGVTAPVPIVISPFTDDAQPSASVVGQDLARSGRFVLQERTRADYIVTGRALPPVEGRVTIEFELVNLLTGQRLLAEQVTAAPSAWRNAAHRIADRIYQRILGVRSAFATRVAYVAVDGVAPALRYRLVVADADGENPRTILDSRLPIMSPAWSPDGESIAYVSFETRSAAVYVQTVRTAERRRVSARAGVNGAPAWSPDGKRLALTLSSASGNLDVHVLELDTGTLTRVTEHPAIDTEPVWSSDGTVIYFTSDRAGGPQIYRANPVAGAAVQRVSFSGSYNARPRASPDGRQLAHVTREGAAYRIAVLDLQNGSVRVLSKGTQDESPGFSPDGGTLIYAGRERGQGVLATVSTDGLISQRLQATSGDVREPAWGPFRP